MSDVIGDVRVSIDPLVHKKVMHWVNKADGEVSGFGKVIFENGSFRIVEAYLVEQENGSATTDISAEGLAKLMTDTIRDKGYLNWWWHSHVNFGVFWSGQDKETIKELGEQGMCLATVFNKKDESRTAYYQAATKDGFLPRLTIDNIPLKIDYEVDTSEVEKWDKAFDEKCKTKSPTILGPSLNRWNKDNDSFANYAGGYPESVDYDDSGHTTHGGYGKKNATKNKKDKNKKHMEQAALKEQTKAGWSEDLAMLGLKQWEYLSTLGGWFKYCPFDDVYLQVLGKNSYKLKTPINEATIEEVLIAQHEMQEMVRNATEKKAK